MRSFSTKFVRLALAILCLDTGIAFAQEIRRAIPVNPPVAATAAPGVPATPAPPPPDAFPPPKIPELPASVNDTARFLAGLSVSEDSPLIALTQDPAWQRHAAFFDQAWAKLDARQLVGIRNWQANYLPNAAQPMPVAFYMFSGPDFLYADQFFPNAGTYILAGTEPIGPLPDVLRFRRSGARPRPRRISRNPSTASSVFRSSSPKT